MGLVLLSGFCPCALSGLSPSELLKQNMPEKKMDGIYEEWYGGRYAEKWELPGHPPAKWILEQVSRDPNPQLLRLDGLILSNKALIEAYLLIRQPPPIKHYDPNIHGQLLQQLHRGINILLINWIEYKEAHGWQVLKGENVIRLPPSEFMRFAEKIKFDIPWLGFAKAHFPHLLPEESTGRPTSATDTASNADTYRALKAKRDELEKCLENTKSELEKLRSEKGAIEKAMVDKTGIPSERAESTYQNIIAARLDCIAGDLPNIEKHPSFLSEAKLIEAISNHFQGYYGLSKSNLSRKFPEAKRALQSK